MSENTDLHKMTRAELDDYAGELGMADAAEYPNKADLIAAIEADQHADEDLDAVSDAELKEAGQRYLVLKAITVASGQTYMPGEEFTPGDDFPTRRPRQLVEQHYLRPID